jgi:hypothetical protein
VKIALFTETFLPKVDGITIKKKKVIKMKDTIENKKKREKR